MARKYYYKFKETTNEDKEEESYSSKTVTAATTTTTTKTSKVSTTSRVALFPRPKKQELWDIVRVVFGNNDGDESCACRYEGCNDRAVATWTSNLDPSKWQVECV
jgi:hypothetical protein